MLILFFPLLLAAKCPTITNLTNGQSLEEGSFQNIQVEVDNSTNLPLYGVSLYINREYIATDTDFPYNFEQIDFNEVLSCGVNKITVMTWMEDRYTHYCYDEISVNVNCQQNVENDCITFREAIYGDQYVSNGDIILQTDEIRIQAFFQGISNELVDHTVLLLNDEVISEDNTNPWRFDNINDLECGDQTFTVKAYSEIGSLLCEEELTIHVLCVSCSDIYYAINAGLNGVDLPVYLGEYAGIIPTEPIDVEIGDRLDVFLSPEYVHAIWSGPNGFNQDTYNNSKFIRNTGAESLVLDFTNAAQSGEYNVATQIGRGDCYSNKSIEIAVNSPNSINCDAVVIPNQLPIQAEEACMYNDVTVNFTDQIVQHLNHNSWIEFNVNVIHTQDYYLNYRYAKGSANGTMRIYQNETLINEVDLEGTGSWTNYNERFALVNLEAGISKLRLEFINAESPDNGILNLDFIGFLCADAGSYCDDGLDYTSGDIINTDCNCEGVDSRYRIKVKGASSGLRDIYTLCLDCKMHKDLMNNELAPNAQPFNTEPFNYFGDEYIDVFPETMVDWVLVVARDVDGNALDRIAAIMHEDATITSTSGDEDLFFSNLNYQNSYYISLHSKGHLGVISNTSLNSGELIDFTSDNTTQGIDQTLVLDNTNYMYAGDYNNNGVINSSDFNEWSDGDAEVNTYQPYDADGNGVINNLDYNAWASNKAKLGAEPLIDNSY